MKENKKIEKTYSQEEIHISWPSSSVSGDAKVQIFSMKILVGEGSR